MLESISKLMNLCTKSEGVQPSVLRGEFVPGSLTCKIKGKYHDGNLSRNIFNLPCQSQRRQYPFISFLEVPATEILLNQSNQMTVVQDEFFPFGSAHNKIAGITAGLDKFSSVCLDFSNANPHCSQEHTLTGAA